MKTQFYIKYYISFYQFVLFLLLSFSVTQVSGQNGFVTANCNNITVFLDNTGNYTLTQSNKNAISIGSIALRGILKIEFTPQSFDCSNIGVDTIDVKVIDKKLDFDICQAYITVRDVIGPTFDSIPDPILDISCYESLPMQEILTGSDACSTPIITPIIDTYLENICNGFPVTYRWKIEDSLGNKGDDVTISFNVLPDTLAPVFDILPNEILNVSCGLDLPYQQLLTATDENCRSYTITPSVDPHETNACASYEVVYRWSLSDECGNAADDVIRTFQVLPDTIPPDMVCPGDRTFAVGEVLIRLFAFDNCSDLTIQHRIDFGNNGAFDRAGSTNVIQGDYPVGTHRVLWSVSDECGNLVECTHLFTVSAGSPPSAFCDPIQAFDVESNGCIRIEAKDILDYATDIETDNAVVEATVQVREVNTANFSNAIIICCSELGSTNVELRVEDEQGNTAFCNAQLIITDPHDYCGLVPTSATISGKITTISGNGIPDVTVRLGNSKVTQTDAQGNYSFEDNNLGRNYNLLVEYNNPDILIGVSTRDIVILTRMILGTKVVTDPFVLIAADVNQDKNIDVFDIVNLRRLLLHIDNQFVNKKSWKFFDNGQTYGVDIVDQNYQEIFSIPNLSQDVTLNFSAVKVGDLNGDAQPRYTGVSQERSTPENQLMVQDIKMIKGQKYKVDFFANDIESLDGFQMGLNYNSTFLDFVDVEAGLIAIENHHFNGSSEKDNVYFSWNGEQIQTLKDDILFSVWFHAKENTSLKDVLDLTSRNMTSEVYDNETTRQIELKMNNSIIKNSLSVTPNPFDKMTLINFHQLTDGNSELRIYTMDGQLTFYAHKYFEKGANSFTVIENDLPNSNVFIYELITESETYIGKLLLLK